MSDRELPVSAEIKTKVASEILKGIESLLEEAKLAVKPMEVDPYRSRLFEFFVTADGAGLIGDERTSSLGAAEEEDVVNQHDLSADGLCRSLARHWGLDMAARDSAAQQTKLPQEQLERMRVLWSVMRMWMEWNYAWCRWNEFHNQNTTTSAAAAE